MSEDVKTPKTPEEKGYTFIVTFRTGSNALTEPEAKKKVEDLINLIGKELPIGRLKVRLAESD